MTENFEHIDELFRSKLSDAQIEAPSGAFEAIQNQVSINATHQATVQSTSTIFSSTVGLKIAGIIGVVGLSIGAAVWIGADVEKQVETSPEKKQEIQLIAVPEYRMDSVASKKNTVKNRVQTTVVDLGNSAEEVLLEDIEEQGMTFDLPVKVDFPDQSRNNYTESRNYVKNEPDEELEERIQIEQSRIDLGSNEDVKPNVFTPNGDGINDSFFVELKSADFIELVVLNRAGMKVFGTTDKNRKWAGDHLGIPCSKGVYSVILKTRNKLTSEISAEQWVLNLVKE